MIQSRIVQIGVAPLSLVSFCHPSVLGWGRLISYINLYFFFRVPNILIFFSPVRARWGFRLWSWKITFLYLGMKDLGRGTQLNIDNTRSLIHVPQVYFRHLADRRSLHGGRIHIHTHTHTHTHKHTHKHTHTYTQCPVSQALKIPECWFLKTLPRMTRTLKKTDIFSWNIWSKYLNSQVSSVTLIFRLLYQLSKIAKKYTKLTYITC